MSPTETMSPGSASWRIESSREGITPSVLYPTSSKTSSRSILTTVPSMRSPSLKNFRVFSTAARNSSAVPMSFTATCFGAFTVVSMVIEIGTPLFVYSGRNRVKAFYQEN